MKSQKSIQSWIVISAVVIIFSSGSPASASDLVVESKGKAPGPEMKLKQSKVPQYDLVQKKVVKGKTELNRVKSIPRLNVGEEARLKAASVQPVALPGDKAFKEVKAQKLPAPKEVLVDTKALSKWKPVPAAKVLIATDKGAGVTPDAPRLAQIADPSMKEPKPELKKIDEMQPPELKLLQALIFLEIKKDYNMALALFAELLDEASLKTEATYQMALTAKALGLYSEYKFRMSQILNEASVEWQKKAALSLAESAAEGDKSLVGTLDPKLASLKLELDKADQYQMNRAKYYLDKGDLSKAFAAVDEILMDSPLYTDALFLKSLILYGGNQVQEAIGLQQAVLKDVEAKRPKSEFRSVVALTLARLHFQAGQYKEAFDMYLKVDKSHPEWMQAMMEQAWSQILSEDYEGAAGNMFSLHTDFFKKSFAPESYVVRTVGYLNLCQYGDGARVIQDFKRKYTPVVKQLVEYGKNKSDNTSYYDTIKTWAKNPDLQTVDGLPREFIFALTRHPSFILEQKMINSVEDQVAKINQISVNLIQTERQNLASQSDAQAKLALAKKKMDEAQGERKKVAATDYAYQEKRLLSAKIQLHIAKKARTAIKDIREAGLNRLEKEKARYRDLAGLAIKKRYGQMMSRLSDTLDQSEVLKYELFSGAGDHLRYQMAGGDVNTKDRAELKVDDGKALNWEFKGEIWEDELGYYRSSLKNVCPPEDKVSSNYPSK